MGEWVVLMRSFILEQVYENSVKLVDCAFVVNLWNFVNAECRAIYCLAFNLH